MGLLVEGASREREELVLLTGEVDRVAVGERARGLRDARDGLAAGETALGHEAAQDAVDLALRAVLRLERGHDGRDLGEVREAGKQRALLVGLVAEDGAIEVIERLADRRHGLGIVVIGLERAARGGQRVEVLAQALVGAGELREDVRMGKFVVHGCLGERGAAPRGVYVGRGSAHRRIRRSG